MTCHKQVSNLQYNSLLQLFKLKGRIPIVAAEDGTIAAATARDFSSYSKLDYLHWIQANIGKDRAPVEASPKSGTVVAGVLALNFNAATDFFDLIAYEILCGFSDNVAPGPVQVSHSWLDMQNVLNVFTFTAQPDFLKQSKQMKVIYLASSGVGAKFFPTIHHCRRAIPVNAGPTVITTNDFAFVAPNDTRITILPMSLASVHIATLFSAYVPILARSLSRYRKLKKAKKVKMQTQAQAQQAQAQQAIKK